MTQGAIQLNDEQRAMLAGEQGLARQMGMRLLLDLAAMAGAERLTPIASAHLSGVSPLTGGLGLRLFLARLAGDANNAGPGVVVPTTLNAAGCDEAQFPAMRITEPDFLDHHREIISLYARLGVRTIQSCVPYEWEGVLPERPHAPAAWAESNAICYANSYCDLRTNRESGLSALACALTGYAPEYGLLGEEARRPNLAVTVTAPLDDPTDFSILGDWIGKQRRPGWRMPFGPIPAIAGLPAGLSHEQRKALTAAAANYGCPLLYLVDEDELPNDAQDRLTFGEVELAGRYADLRPRSPVSLVVLGCPQASVGELRAIARLLRGRRVAADPAGPGQPPPLWVFTSAAARAIAEQTSLADAIRGSGALLLENTCPEVVPYDQTWVRHVLTNSMKAEHYIKSGLNGIPTSVMRLADCVAVAAGEMVVSEQWSVSSEQSEVSSKQSVVRSRSVGQSVVGDQSSRAGFASLGKGLPSQGDFTVVGEALVTDAPLTFLGYVNRETGVIEEDGHPANGQSLAGKIALFPRGTGSSVAPYVLLELFYRGVAPIAIINSEVDQQTAPACSLEGIPYAYGFDADVNHLVQTGDQVEVARRGDVVTLRILGEGGQ
jgi:predicted aconitase/predicted aconitase with swiveling domain